MQIDSKCMNEICYCIRVTIYNYNLNTCYSIICDFFTGMAPEGDKNTSDYPQCKKRLILYYLYSSRGIIISLLININIKYCKNINK